MKNNQFIPSEVQIPAGVKVKLVVRNENSTASEFESTQLHREKVVPPGQEITVYVGPLKAGRYEFFDDFNPKTRVAISWSNSEVAVCWRPPSSSFARCSRRR